MGPKGMAFAPRTGEVYVVDTGNHRVQVFSIAGNYLRGWGTEGTGESQFREPGGIAIHPASGNIYVADTGNHRMQVFRVHGAFISQFGN